MAVSIKQDVLRFQVTVQDVLAVQVLNGEEELSSVDAGLVLAEGYLTGEMEREVLPGAVV